MNWIGIVAAAIGGGLGGLIGGLILRATGNGAVGRIIMIVLVVAGARLGSQFLGPAIELEVALQDPKNPLSIVLKESGVPPMQARWDLLQAYYTGGTDALERKASELGAKGQGALADRIAYASDAQVDRFYRALVTILRRAQKKDPVVCANWAAGVQGVLIRESGATKEEIAEFEAAVTEILTVTLPPADQRKKLIPDVVVAARLQGALGVRAERDGLDIELLAEDVGSMTPQRKKSYCDLLVALYDEIDKLPDAERISYVRAILSQR